MASSHDDERPHLVASDLDGTLLRSDGSVSARTGEVWSALAGAGVETVVVTARPPRWLHHLSDIVGGTRDAHSVAICGNGAFVYDVADRVVLESHGFEPGVARGLVGDLLREFPNAGAAVETDRGMYRTRAYPDQHVGEPGHDTAVGDVTDCELAELPDDLVRWCRRTVVDDEHLVPLVEEPLGDVRADEAGPSRHHHPSWARVSDCVHGVCVLPRRIS